MKCIHLNGWHELDIALGYRSQTRMYHSDDAIAQTFFQNSIRVCQLQKKINHNGENYKFQPRDNVVNLLQLKISPALERKMACQWPNACFSCENNIFLLPLHFSKESLFWHTFGNVFFSIVFSFFQADSHLSLSILMIILLLYLHLTKENSCRSHLWKSYKQIDSVFCLHQTFKHRKQNSLSYQESM